MSPLRDPAPGRFHHRVLARLSRTINQLRPAPEVSPAEWSERFHHDIYLERIRARLAPRAGTALRVLDAGCGTGALAVRLAREGHHVTGIDTHRSSMTVARRRAAEAGVDLDLREGELGRTLPTLDRGAFDLVLCIDLLYTCPDYADLVAEMVARLRPGGVFAGTFRTPYYFITTLLARGDVSGALYVATHREGTLRIATLPTYYNWQTPDEIREVVGMAGVEDLKLDPVGVFTGRGVDGTARLTDLDAVEDGAAREQLAQLERLNLPALEGAGRFVLATGRRAPDAA